MPKLALLIGVSQYGEGIPPLSAPPNDVEAMKRVLENPEMGEFDKIDTLINPDYSKMTEAIKNLFEISTKKDLVLLFFSGHGITDDDNQLYLATRITTENNFLSTAVSSSFIQKISKNGNYAKRQVIILDCCYSGAFPNGYQTKSTGINFEKELGAEGRAVLTSSSATETSFQHEKSRLSIYTKYIVEGIETGKADENNDGKIHLRELHSYVTKKVSEEKPKMSPKIFILEKEGYDILLSKNCNVLKIKEQKKSARINKKDYYVPAIAIGIIFLTLYEIFKVITNSIPSTRINPSITPSSTPTVSTIVPSDTKKSVTVSSSVTPSPALLSKENALDQKKYYNRLEYFLSSNQWKVANIETERLIITTANREKEGGYLTENDWSKFPCTDLRKIDQLWMKYSKGRFGFSVQKQIWESVGGHQYADYDIRERFGDKLGWRREEQWLVNLDDAILWEKPRLGELPVWWHYTWGFAVPDEFISSTPDGKERSENGVSGVLSRAKTCKL